MSMTRPMISILIFAFMGFFLMACEPEEKEEAKMPMTWQDKFIQELPSLGHRNWVVVAESESAADTVAGFDAGLQLKQEVLESEGIPFAYTPYAPGADMDPFGMQVTFQLLVPEEYAETAKALLALVKAAPPVYPPGYSPEE